MPDPESSPPASTGPRPGRLRGLYQRLRTPSGLRMAVDYLAVAILALVPMLASQPGTVTDDTKTYLYLDPGRYIRQAVSLWDPNVGLGTVTHENIGYLLPMGPFYWVMAELHVPLWVAQRLWMAGLLFAAGAGVLYLCRTMALTGPGRYVAAVAFMFTPYVLQYAGRISVILMPWAGLPWMIAFVVLALRRGGWRYPALFALVVALVSGINASSILYVGIGPALYLPYSVLVVREATWRRVWSVVWRVGVLSALVSLWWAIGLEVEAAYGVNVLKYTETVQATSSTSVASEIIRGLGYWYFYGSDRVGQWTQASVAYTQNGALIAMSFVVPVLALLAAAFVKWRQRAYFALVVVVGMVLAVGAYPYANPSGVGSLLKALMVDTTAGLAMRSTDRASPLIILSLAMFLGAGVSAVARRVRKTGLMVGLFALAAVAGASVPLWTGAIIANGFTQPAVPPAYVEQAAHTLDTTHPGTRVYALPGNNFAAYRWGDTIDTVYPGLLTRPFVTHEQQIMGSLATADVLNAVDNPLQNGTMDWNTLAPMASLMSAGDVLVQYDQQFERYDVPNPQSVALQLATTPPGLSDPISYGTPVPNISSVPDLDEQALARPANQGWTAPLVSYTVTDPRPIVRTESLQKPLVVAGDADGLVSASSVGLLAGNPTILYAGTLDTDPALEQRVLSAPADLVVTDTNRKQAFEWNTLSENQGYTETAAQGVDPNDQKDAPIDLFPSAPSDAQTTAVLNGVDSVTASSYGSSLTYLPEDQPAAALDGNVQTAWVADSFTVPNGQWWQVKLTHPTSQSGIRITQPVSPDADRWITRVQLTFDGRDPISVNLGPASRTDAGQPISFSPRTFSTLRITITGYQVAKHHAATIYESAVGFAEVTIPGVQVDETIAMPQDLLRASGARSLFDPLTLIMSRLRTSGFPPRTDPEPVLSRTFWLPTARTFSLTGQARISPLVPDDEIDRLVGRPGSSTTVRTGVVAYSQGRLPGDLTKGAINTIDGSSSTIWEPGFGAAHQAGEWLEYDLPKPVTFSSLDLQVVADGEHSVPTSLTVSTDSGSDHVVLPPIADGRIPGSVVSVPLTIPQLTGQKIRITFDTVRLESTINYDSEAPEAMPLGIAEVGIVPIEALFQPVPADIPAACTNTLLSVDGAPLWVSVSGTSATALARGALNVSLCGPDAAGLPLGPGDHTVTSAPGQTVGFDIDQLTLASSAGGTPAPIAVGGQLTAPTITATPPATVTGQTSTTIRVSVRGVTGLTAPFDLVMGQSLNAGWVATVNGHSLGAPTLVDGFANGWTIDPATLGSVGDGGSLAVTLRWTPQRRVNIALVISALTILACLVLAFLPRRRRRLPRRPGWLPRSGLWGSLTWPDRFRRPATHLVVPTQADDRPLLTVPFSSEGPRASLLVSLVVGAVTGGVAAAIAAPLPGLLVGVATVAALLLPRARLVLGLVAVALVAAAGLSVLIQQSHQHFVTSGTWPTNFQSAGNLVWAGVVFLGADAAVEIVRRRQTRATADGDDGDDSVPSSVGG